MGYETYFSGEMEIKPILKPNHLKYLAAFTEKRQVGISVAKVENLPDPLRKAVGLPLGENGMFFVGDDGIPTDAIVQDPNPAVPGVWCDWRIVNSEDDNIAFLEWNGSSKFYEFEKWLQFVLDKFLIPWGYTVNGIIEWDGEASDDFGYLQVTHNQMAIYDGIQGYVRREGKVA